jgi:hypothetical protein
MDYHRLLPCGVARPIPELDGKHAAGHPAGGCFFCCDYHSLRNTGNSLYSAVDAKLERLR